MQEDTLRKISLNVEVPTNRIKHNIKKESDQQITKDNYMSSHPKLSECSLEFKSPKDIVIRNSPKEDIMFYLMDDERSKHEGTIEDLYFDDL